MVWIKLYINLLDDVDFCLLSDEAKFHFLGMLLLAAKMNNRLPNNPNFLAQKLSATSQIDVEFLLSKKFLVTFKSLKTNSKPASDKLPSDYQNVCLDKEEKREDKEKRKKEERRKNGDAVASSRKDLREEKTRIRDIQLESFHNDYYNWKLENGFEGDPFLLMKEIKSGTHDSDIIKFAQV